MPQTIAMLIPLLLIAFWLWMFGHMLNNKRIPSPVSSGFGWPPETRNQWIVAFVLLNFLAAGYYYFTEYKK